MKPKAILLIIFILIITGIIIQSLYSADSYSNFTEATKTGKEIQIIGKLDKTKPIIAETTGGFSFYLIDNKGTEKKVMSNQTKPMHFEKLEQVILKGKIENNVFIASELLMKCPSKYVKKQFHTK